MLGAAARRLASVVLVDARGADDGEPPQQLAGGAAERNHGEAAHDARLGAREPALHALEAERAVVLVGDAPGNVAGELDKPVVELAKVAEHERPHDAELVAEVLLATADAVEQVVVAARA